MESPFSVSTLHIHLDESGDFNFYRGKDASIYYIFAVTWTYEPQPLANQLTLLRFRFLREGIDISKFHAADDNKKNRSVRDTVVQYLVGSKGWRYCAVVVEKPKVDPFFHKHTNRANFYSSYALMPLLFIFRGGVRADTQRVLIYTDRLPPFKREDQRFVTSAIKRAAHRELSPKITFHIYHHSSESNAWLQVTDYCCWAVHRKWEIGDREMYDGLLSHLSKPEIDVLGSKTTTYY